MKLRTKTWLVSQGLLVLTACIIQVTFYKAIRVGPVLGIPKRPYWDVISGVEPEIPAKFLSQKLPKKGSR